MFISFDSKIDSKDQIMTSQLMTSFHNVDLKFLNSNFLYFFRKSTARGVKWKLFVHISKIKGDIVTFWILEKSQSKNGDPPLDKYFKLKLCFPLSNLTYVAYWLPFMSRIVVIKKMPIDVFPALLSTWKRISHHQKWRHQLFNQQKL